MLYQFWLTALQHSFMIISTVNLGNLKHFKQLITIQIHLRRAFCWSTINSWIEFKLTITDNAGHTFIQYIAIVVNVDLSISILMKWLPPLQTR